MSGGNERSKSQPRILVVGGGSIGQRHTKNLVELGANVTVQEPNPDKQFIFRDMGVSVLSKDNCDSLMEYFHGAIVAVPTHLHAQIAFPLLQAGLKVMIEKPLAHTTDAANSLQPYADQIRIGYSMRYHPAIQAIEQCLPSIGRIIYARAEVGQYLPQWHPNEDYRQWYMAKREQGGGALLDLSHELDYLQWLIGTVSQADAYVGHIDRTLEITSDDLADIRGWLGRSTRFSCHMDLIDRSYNRRVRILGEKGTIEWSKWGLTYPDGSTDTALGNPDRNLQFVSEMEDFLTWCSGGFSNSMCTFERAYHTLKVAEDLWVEGHYKYKGVGK